MLKTKNCTNAETWLLVIVLLLTSIGCEKDPKDKKFTKPNCNSDCVVCMNFEMEVTTSARVVNASDENELSQIDRIMALPHRERFVVQACYSSKNEKRITMTMSSPKNPIIYPDNVADGYIKPDYQRVEVIDGFASYYDISNNLVKTGVHDEDAVVVQNILQMVANRKILTTEEFTQGLNIMRDNGMEVQHHENNLASIRLNNPDGSYSIQILDKLRQAAIGNFNYNSNGDLQTRSMLNFVGTAQQPVLKHALTESKYMSVEKDIPMWVKQSASFDNFNITFQ